MMRSAIYQGYVAHARPGAHKLRYRVFMLALDLEELPRLNSDLRFFGHNKLRLVSAFDRDHARGVRQSIRPQIEEVLSAAGLACGGRMLLLTMPRMFNYVFNPLSVYFCYHRNGDLAALVHEVSNTFGERHFYALPARAQDGRIRQTCDKDFFVSPFLERELRYEFDVTEPDERVRIAITLRRGEDIAFTASFSGERRNLNDANILRAWAGNPLMTLSVIIGIHWEAVKMLMKGVRYIGRGAASRATRRRPRLTAL